MSSTPDNERTPLVSSTTARDDAAINVTQTENDPNSTSSSPLYRFLRRLPLVGYILVFLACLCMTSAAVIVKVIADTDPFMLTAYRNAIIFLCAVPRLAYYRISPEPAGKRKLLLLRALFSSVYTASLFYSFRNMPLGDARTITATHPIFVTVLACAFLREACGAFEVVGLAVMLVGMVLVMQPPFIFGNSPTHDTTYMVAACFAIVGTLCQAGGFIATRSVKGVDFAVISVWNGLVGIFPALILSLAFGTFRPPSLADTPLVLLIGVLSFIGQILMTLALQVEEAGSVSLTRKADDILVAFAIQVLGFGQMPDALSATGAVLITSTVLVSGGRKLVEKRSRCRWLRAICCLLTSLAPEETDTSDPMLAGNR